jgi:hypothetical protein
MLYRSEMERDGTVRHHLHIDSGLATETVIHDVSHGYLSTINQAFEELRADLWPLNKFMQLHEGWRVAKSAYGISTAWEAFYDSGKAGPVVSFNAEMGMSRYQRS